MTTINLPNMTFPLTQAEGGTGVTSFGTTNGIVKYNGSDIVTDQYALLNSSDVFTNTKNPAFFAYKSATSSNVVGNGGSYSFICNTELFDQTSSYNNTTGIFTVPKAGIYVFGACAYSSNTTNSATEMRMWFITTQGYDPYVQKQRTSTNDTFFLNIEYEFQMAAGDTIYPQVYVYGMGSNNCNIVGGSSPIVTCFWGYFVG